VATDDTLDTDVSLSEKSRPVLHSDAIETVFTVTVTDRSDFPISVIGVVALVGHEAPVRSYFVGDTSASRERLNPVVLKSSTCLYRQSQTTFPEGWRRAGFNSQRGRSCARVPPTSRRSAIKAPELSATIRVLEIA